MKKWYCVTSSFDNMGRVTAAVTDVIEAEECPHNSFRSTTRKMYIMNGLKTNRKPMIGSFRQKKPEKNLVNDYPL